MRTSAASTPRTSRITGLLWSGDLPFARSEALGTDERPRFDLRYRPSMPETIFTKILAGEIPCHRVYEDEKVLAFLDVAPLSRGHVLVIPKEPAATVDALSDESAAAIGRVLPRLCRAVMQATGTRDYNILQNNGSAAHQAVFHVHFHIIPKPSDAAGLGVHWPAKKLDGADAPALAAAIESALEGQAS